jgi:hypothetical protein
MASRNGYIFDTEAEARSAIAAIDAHYSDQLDGVRTVNWTTCHEWGDAWVIFADASLVDVLGDAEELPEIDEDLERLTETDEDL